MQWRDRLIGALRDKAGGLAEEGIHQFHKIDASMEAGRDDLPITKVFAIVFVVCMYIVTKSVNYRFI